jgi:poly(A) polymerase
VFHAEGILLIRYHKGPDGRPVKKAFVYTAPEHGIDPRSVDPDAVRIIERLRHNGHAAYIVGGAVRDLLLGRMPKDYDIVTDAQPPRIKRLFYRSRIIGRRFRLVHVYVGSRIFEISTFRSIANGTIGNTYGTIDEDAKRRDFSLNALYFDPLEDQLVDFVGGYKDIKTRKIVPVIPLKTIFSEDPVRMLRAVKYAVLTDFAIQFWTRLTIRRQSRLLHEASVSRLGEEAIKIFSSGKALPIIEALQAYGLLGAILPNIQLAIDSGGDVAKTMKSNLAALDGYVAETGDKNLGVLMAFVVRDAVRSAASQPLAETTDAYHHALQAARDFLAPLTMPRVDLEFAVKAEFKAPEPKPKTRKPRRRRRRKSGTPKPAGTVEPEDTPA